MYTVSNVTEVEEADVNLSLRPFKPYIEFIDLTGRFRIRFTDEIQPPTFELFPEFTKEGRMRKTCLNGHRCEDARILNWLSKSEKEQALEIINRGLVNYNG